jgi:hypothetical protein
MKLRVLMKEVCTVRPLERNPRADATAWILQEQLTPGLLGGVSMRQ